MEGQQHEATMRDLRASLDQCIDDIRGLCRCSTEFQMDIQSRDEKHFELEESLFTLHIELEKGFKECREGLLKIQCLPESGSISASDHQEHVKAVQQVLDECRTQVVSHEKKLLDGAANASIAGRC